MSRPSKWRLVFPNGDTETINDLVNVRVDVRGRLLYVENPSQYVHEPIRTINMDNLRSWEPIE
jgi:hypothetical protein